MKKLRILYFLIFFVLLTLSPMFIESAIAQPPPPPPVEIPIDGGLGFLLAAGIIYGAKKLNDSKKRQEI